MRGRIFNLQNLFYVTLSHDEVQVSPWKSEIEQFLIAFDAVFRQSRLFCTHEKALQLLETGSKRIQTIVFDEDPMGALFRADQVSREDVEEIVRRLTKSDYNHTQLIEFLGRVQSAPPNVIETPPEFPRGTRKLLNEVLSGSGINSPVHALLACSGYVQPQLPGKPPSNEILCITHRKLPPQYNYVMLSATPIIPLYKRVYPERLRLVETGAVKLRGNFTFTGNEASPGRASRR